ncbi:MAG: hypothetical protein BJ554DRAFT_1940 [Olpidium bornovanus]|uniref:Transmembrane protein n=1 Tax=Olpidium bornovanus TaxID=278681 RepID=A0A8H7ZRP0_9FUNG|nr:MAG: hypothetical protein BJ554DRAFT_1940 [Olpidium bornovanus]
MTGHITKFASSVGSFQISSALWYAMVIGSFISGSSVSGYVTGDNKFRLGRSYGGLLLLESLAFLVMFFLLKFDVGWAATSVAAFACGLQNAMATSYSGAVLRTTHCTGMCTDVGVLLGQIARKNPRVEKWRLKVFIPLLVAYAVGGLAGLLCSAALGGPVSILIPSMVTGLAAVFYLSWGTVKVAADFLQRAIDGLNLPDLEGGGAAPVKSKEAMANLIAAPIIEKYLSTPANVADIDRNITMMMSEMEQTLKAALLANASAEAADQRAAISASAIAPDSNDGKGSGAPALRQPPSVPRAHLAPGGAAAAGGSRSSERSSGYRGERTAARGGAAVSQEREDSEDIPLVGYDEEGVSRSNDNLV